MEVTPDAWRRWVETRLDNLEAVENERRNLERKTREISEEVERTLLGSYKPLIGKPMTDTCKHCSLRITRDHLANIPVWFHAQSGNPQCVLEAEPSYKP